MAWVWLSSGFMLPLGMRLQNERLPSGVISHIPGSEITNI